jgi:hypothetical protein
MFKATYKERNYYFDWQNIFGDKMGIPCLQIGNDLVSIHLMTISNYSGFNDTEDNKLYELEFVRCFERYKEISYIGLIVFEKGCYSILIKNLLNKNGNLIVESSNDNLWEYSFYKSKVVPMYEFKDFVKFRVL